MDFSKIKKIFYIVAIISMLLSIKSRVFATSNDFLTNTTTFNTVTQDVTIGSSNYGGSITFQNIPSFIFEYSNVLLVMNVNQYSLGNKSVLFLFSNNKIFVDNNGVIRGENNKDYYYRTGSAPYTPINYGSLTLSSFTLVNSSNTYWNGYLSSDTNYSYLALQGAIYDYTNQDTIIKDNNPFIYPSFDNTQEIEQGNPDGVFIFAGDFSNTDDIYFHLLEVTTGLANQDNSRYYYNDHTFILNKDSNYYSTWYDPSIDGFYYYIPRYKLGLSQNTSYLYVLNNSKKQIQNSNGIIQIDKQNGVYDVVESDTSGVITATEEETDRMKNIQSSINENQETVNNINDTLTNTNVSEETETDIGNSLNFNNQNNELNNLNNGFFSRLTNMLSNLLGYDLSEDTSVNLPLPNSNKNIVLHSIDIHNNVSGALRLIINAFWVYIFTFYLWKFINKIYIAVSSGNILDSFSSNGEAITNDML